MAVSRRGRGRDVRAPIDEQADALFHKYDEQAAEFVRREGVDPVPVWPHVDVEGRPE